MVESCVHGFRVYKDTWMMFDTGEVLGCEREDRNLMDPYVLAIKKGA